MNAKLSKFLSCAGAALILLGTGTFGVSEAMADDKHRRDFRRHDGQVVRAAAANHDYRRHERDRRAFIAGAAVQQHRNDNRDYYRNDYRDGYQDRYRDRHYDRVYHDHDDNKIGAALVGAAVGAVVTGVVMSNKNSTSTTTTNIDSK
jgi:hypothetical protein